MGVAKELYFKMQEEELNKLPIETLAELHRLGATFRYYDSEKRKNFEYKIKNSKYQKEQNELYQQYLKQNGK